MRRFGGLGKGKDDVFALQNFLCKFQNGFDVFANSRFPVHHDRINKKGAVGNKTTPDKGIATSKL